MAAFPLTLAAINDTDDPSVVMSQVIDELNAMEADARTFSSATAFVSGTAYTNPTVHCQNVGIATATAGTATVAIIDPAGVVHTLVTSLVTRAVDFIQAEVPGGWGVKVTLATSTGAANWTVY